MAIINEPTPIPSEFATNGNKNVIPANNSGESGTASFDKGFPPITSTPLLSGGIPPKRADMNGILNWFSQFLRYYQNGGVFTYLSTNDYGTQSFVRYQNKLWECLVQNGPNTQAGVQPPQIGSQYWRLVSVDVFNGQNQGLVPQPTASQVGYFLSSDGTWKNVDLADVTLSAGFMQDFGGNGTPEGRWLFCNGAAVSRTTYADLFAAIGTTYGAGNGSTTFNLPNFTTGKFKEGSTTAGVSKNAGLPNIAGTFSAARTGNGSSPTPLTSGAFTENGRWNAAIKHGGGDDWGSTYGFSASLSNSIYGRSSTVQPSSITTRVFIRY